jgi:uncharacterized 2Fe-2S/4Fe-4S cluster protein (DUF4445 family)
LFQPDGRTVDASAGETLLEAARKAGLDLNAPCGGVGVCGNCKVQVTAGDAPVTEGEQDHFTEDELSAGMRLACQFVVVSNVTCVVPESTRLAAQKILDAGVERSVELDPVVTKQHVVTSAPELPDQRSDADRLAAAMKPPRESLRIPLHTLRGLPTLLRHANFDVTVVAMDGEVVCVEPGDTTSQCFGVAFDVGTTTVVGTLVDLRAGKDLAVAGRTNPQIAYGDDVVSRIAYASSEKDGLAVLHAKIIGCINDIIHELTSRARVHAGDIYEVVAAGNTTMMHLLLGVDAHAIAQAPYVAGWREGISVSAGDLGLKICRCGRLTVLPNVAGFVGADTVAVVLATGMHQSDDMQLAIDIGTNGEIVLGTKDNLVACSTAAGPAFEGARIKFGMRAAAGAIERVDIDDDVRLKLIGGKGDCPPDAAKGTVPLSVKVVGLCGTGIIDAIAELLRVGVIDETGRMIEPSDLSSVLSEAVRRRVRVTDGACDFVLAWPDETRSGEPVFLTQRDVREVQLAKAAIFAGMEIMKKRLGVTNEDIHAVYLAGAFGNYIRPERALRIGLLPAVSMDRIRFVGNAASTGAKMALVNRACRAEAEDISRRVHYLELAGRDDFQMEFADAMFFPTP